MARTAQLRYFKTVAVSGSVYKLTTVAGTTANNATIARYVVGGLTSARRYTPLAVATADVSPPTVGATQGNSGWRDDVAENASEQVRYAAGVWTTTVRYKRSGQLAEIDQSAKITVIFYRVTTSGTFVAELGRVTSAELTHTTTVQTVALSTASIGPFTFNAGDKVQIEVYVQTFAAGLAAAPTVATDLWLAIDESSTSSRISAVPVYDILYARGVADTSAATDALIRAVTTARAIADTAPATDVLTRAVSFPRAIANTAPASDALGRVLAFARAIANTAPATDAVTRSAGTFARSIANTAGATDALARLLTYGRFLDEEIGTTAVDPVRTPGRKIEGVARNSAGTPVAGAIVKLVRQADDRVVRTMTTVAGGAYSFSRDILDDKLYYVSAFIEGVPQTHGLTDRGLLPVLV